MIVEQLRMLSYEEYSQVICFQSANASGTDGVKTTEQARGECLSRLCAIEHSASIALKVQINF